MRCIRPILILLACGPGLMLFGRLSLAFAEEPAKAAEAPAEKPEANAEGRLTAQQQQVGEKFRELEKLLLRMAELTAPTDPRRAALLRQAVTQSKDRDIDHQFEQLVELLKQERLSLVVKSQGEVQQDLAKLLELLLSEDRSKRIESEKERIREYLKRVNKIIKDQKGIQTETARQGDPRKLAERQSDLSDKTGELAGDLEQDAGKKSPETKDAAEGDDKQDGEKKEGEKKDSDKKDGEKSDGSKSDGKDADGKKSDAKDADDKKSEKPGDSDPKKSDQEKADKKNDDQDKDPGDKKSDGESKDKPGDKADGEPKPGEEGQPGKPGEKADGEPKPGGKPGKPQDQPPMPGEGESGESGEKGEEPPPNDSPAQKRLQQAQQRMKEAQEKLEQAKREDAAEKQAEAIKELEQAKADLEEILRQLREEEMSRTLAMLEARFRKMLDQQVEVYEGTQRLDKVPQVERDRDDEIESGRLSRKESLIAVEADKALAVLREEGSAVAFPEAVAEMRDDMEQVVARLSQAKVGEVTQGIEKDIIAALEEMIASLKKAQKDMEEKSKQGEPPPSSGEQEPPLVDTLAELKMIRALQMRVNVRTQRYAEMTKTEQTETRELLDALKLLAEREQRIHKVTRDIVVGRNR